MKHSHDSSGHGNPHFGSSNKKPKTSEDKNEERLKKKKKKLQVQNFADSGFKQTKKKPPGRRELFRHAHITVNVLEHSRGGLGGGHPVEVPGAFPQRVS